MKLEQADEGFARVANDKLVRLAPLRVHRQVRAEGRPRDGVDALQDHGGSAAAGSADEANLWVGPSGGEVDLDERDEQLVGSEGGSHCHAGRRRRGCVRARIGVNVIASFWRFNDA